MIDKWLQLTGGLLAEDEAPVNPIAGDPDLAIWTAVVFVTLVLVLWRFAWKPISAGLEKREKSIADQIEQARHDAEQAAQRLRDYEQRLAAAAEEANQILVKARQEADKARERIVTEAREAAERERQRAIADIRAAKDQAVRALAAHSVDSAIDLAGSLVKKELNKDLHASLIQDSLERFGSVN